MEAVGNWLPLLDDGEALQLLLETEPFVEAHASEQRRTEHWRHERRFIVRLLSPDISGELGAKDVTAAADAIERRARREEWQPDSYCAALMAVASRSVEWDQEYLGRGLLKKIPSRSLYFQVRYNHAVRWLAVDLDINAGALAANARDWDRALRSYSAAFANALSLNISEIGMDLLQRLQEVITVAGLEYADRAIAVMSGIAPHAEKWLGQPAARKVQDTCKNIFAGLTGQAIDPEYLIRLFQIAKGRAFSAALSRSQSPWVPGQSVRALLRDIAQLEEKVLRDRPEQAAAVVANDPPALDESQLLTSYLARSRGRRRPGATALERLGNLQRACDEQINQELAPAGEEVVRWSLDDATADYMAGPDVAAALGTRSVLMEVYVGADSHGQLATHVVAMTPEEFCRGTISTGFPSSRVTLQDQAEKITLSPVGLMVSGVRDRILRPPGPRLVNWDAGEDLELNLESFMGPPMLEFLDRARAGGRDHLCIVPHGALHFYPMHLLGPVGQPLASQWIVTYAPSLRLLPGRRHPVSDHAADVSVIGCSLSGGSPFGLAVVESAVEEAQDVAALYGTVPLLEEQATPESVLDVLSRSRRVHIAAHGRHNVTAPAFQAIYLSAGPGNDGRLCAHQILARDLNALELVTMSSCETALGRFDIGDNIRGLPASLMIAGARALVGTLWPVQKDASRVFFTEFHRLLAAGDQLPAKADRRLDAFTGAQRLTRARFPAYRDWGPFYYLGDWS